MILFLSWVIARSVRSRTGFDVVIDLFLLIMMVAMVIGPAYLFLTTMGLTLGDVVIWEIAVFMSVGMMPIGFILFAKLWIEGDTERTKPLPFANLLEHVSRLRVSYICLLVASEFFMGWSFNLATGVISATAGYTAASIASQVTYTLVSYWFIFTMVGEMAFTLALLRKAIRPALRILLALQAAVMLLTPTAIAAHAWEMFALYGEVVVMTGVVVFAFAYLRRTSRDRPLLMYTALFIAANAVMMGAFFWWLVSGDAALLAISILAETVVYFDAILTGSGLGETFHGGPVTPAAPMIPPAVPFPVQS